MSLITDSYRAVISKQDVLDGYGIELFNLRYLFVIVLPNIWSTDGEFTIPEQKQVENNEELASSYERKLIEVKFVLHRFYGIVIVTQGLKLKYCFFAQLLFYFLRNVKKKLIFFLKNKNLR